MKKVQLTFIFSLFFLLSFGQTFDKAIKLTNSLSSLWENGETEKALENSVELYLLHPSFFVERIHNTLAQQIKHDSLLYAQKYLDQLHEKGNKDINKIIAPIYLWSKTTHATSEKEFTEIKKELKDMVADSANYESRKERYCLLTLQELEKKSH